MNKEQAKTIKIEVTVSRKLDVDPEVLRAYIAKAQVSEMPPEEFFVNLRREMERRVCRALAMPMPPPAMPPFTLPPVGLLNCPPLSAYPRQNPAAVVGLQYQLDGEPAGVIMRPEAWKALKAIEARHARKRRAKRHARARMRSRGFVAHGRHT